jgi:hypothetical protein
VLFLVSAMRESSASEFTMCFLSSHASLSWSVAVVIRYARCGTLFTKNLAAKVGM